MYSNQQIWGVTTSAGSLGQIQMDCIYQHVSTRGKNNMISEENREERQEEGSRCLGGGGAAVGAESQTVKGRGGTSDITSVQ